MGWVLDIVATLVQFLGGVVTLAFDIAAGMVTGFAHLWLTVAGHLITTAIAQPLLVAALATLLAANPLPRQEQTP